MIKALVIAVAVVAPVAVGANQPSDNLSIAVACAGGATITAIMKYRDAVKAETRSNIAVADAVIAAIAGIMFGWFGHHSAIGLIEKFSGTTVSAPLSALIMSFSAIYLLEKFMADGFGKFSLGAKKNV
jgi:uncharacterized membrane protein